MVEHFTRIRNLALTQKSRKTPIWLFSMTLSAERLVSFQGKTILKAFQKAFQVSIELYASKCQKNQQTVVDVYRLFCFTTTGNFKRDFDIARSIQIAMPLSCSLLLVVMFGIRRRFSLLLIFQRCYSRRSLLVFDRVVCTYTRSDSDEQRNQWTLLCDLVPIAIDSFGLMPAGNSGRLGTRPIHWNKVKESVKSVPLCVRMYH